MGDWLARSSVGGWAWLASGRPGAAFLGKQADSRCFIVSLAILARFARLWLPATPCLGLILRHSLIRTAPQVANPCEKSKDECKHILTNFRWSGFNLLPAVAKSSSSESRSEGWAKKYSLLVHCLTSSQFRSWRAPVARSLAYWWCHVSTHGCLCAWSPQVQVHCQQVANNISQAATKRCMTVNHSLITFSPPWAWKFICQALHLQRELCTRDAAMWAHSAS